MDDSKIKKKRTIISIILLGLVLFGYEATWNNIDFLFFLAGGLDSPSASFNLAIDRIYKLAERKNLDKIVIAYLREGKNQHLNDIYIRALGPIGNSQSASFLINEFILNENKERNFSTYFSVITSLGLIGNDKVVPILERALKNKDEFRIPTSKYIISRSLYLCTGQSYKYVDEGGETAQCIVTDELKELRRLIEGSKGRKRTYEEMLICDGIYRPPSKGEKNI
jgi:hypothetical protein